MKTTQFLKQSFFIIVTLTLLSIMNNGVFAQDKKTTEKEIPQAVLESFKKSYPNATATGYEVDNEKGKVIYEIESKDGNIQRDIEFTADGNIVEIGEFIDVNSLPISVVNSIKAKFNNANILKAEKKIRGVEISYEVVVNDKEKKKEVLLNSNGNIIKDEEDDGENEDGEDKD